MITTQIPKNRYLRALRLKSQVLNFKANNGSSAFNNIQLNTVSPAKNHGFNSTVSAKLEG